MKISLSNFSIFSKHAFDKTSLINIKAQNNIILLTSQDDGFYIEEYAEGSVLQEGSVSINALSLSNYVNTLKIKSVDLYIENNKLIIHNLKLPINNFTDIKIPKHEYTYFNIQTGRLSYILSKLKKISSERFNGILVNKIDDRIDFVSTDMYRLSRASITDIQLTKSFVIPGNTVNKIIKISKEIDIFEIGYDKNMVIKYNKVKLYSNLLNIKFPNYQGLYEGYKNNIIVTGALLIEIINRVKIISDDKVKLYIRKNKLLFSASNVRGSINEELDVQYDGDDMTVILRTSHLIHALSNSDTEISFHHINGKQIMFAFTESNVKYETVLMPIEEN